jgi:hypothetical protein
LLSIIILAIGSSLTVTLACLANTNLQNANDLHSANNARTTAESGLEIMQFLMRDINLGGVGDTGTERINALWNYMRTKATNEGMTSVNLTAYPTASTPYIFLSPVILGSNSNEFFYGYLFAKTNEVIRMYVMGYSNSILRTVYVEYDLVETAHTAFDYGMATKGPLKLQGNILLTGVNISVESNAYIESMSDILALEMQNSQIAGHVKIVNPMGMVDLSGGQASIGGETGADALNHVSIGVEAASFPTPNPTVFKSYATTDFTASSTTGGVIENVLVKAGTNPKFSGTTTIRGVMYIEQPNVVEFKGGVDITGLIVAEGDLHDDSETNKIIFGGSVDSTSVSELPADAKYSGLHDETGTFIMAPGFSLSFGGSFGTLSGAIVGNGIEFFGSAGGIIQGSVINYSQNKMELTGSSDLFFNRSGLDEIPAGFIPEVRVVLDRDSYSEPMLQCINLDS